MARFDVYLVVGGRYLLDVQTDLVDGIGTRLVVPLILASEAPPRVKRLHPVFALEGQDWVMATHLMAAVPNALLRRPMDNLDRHYDEIVAAIEMIFVGF